VVPDIYKEILPSFLSIKPKQTTVVGEKKRERKKEKMKSLFTCIISLYLKDFACHIDHRSATYSSCSQNIKIGSRVFLL
jgi:hypothetical protein